MFTKLNTIKLMGIFCLILLNSFPATGAETKGEELIFISNRSVPAVSLTKNDIKYLFMGKKKTWANGTMTVVTMPEDPVFKKMFLHKYINKSPESFERYWKSKMYTSGNNAPLQFAKVKNLVAFVSTTKGAIGVIPIRYYNDSLKIMYIEK